MTVARRGPAVLIDDDPTLCRLHGRAISAVGGEVRYAHSVGAGLELVRAVRPWLVVLDIGLPDGSGIQLCERLRRDPGIGPVPVLFLTAFDKLHTLFDGLLAGGDGFILKGIEYDRFMRHVAMWRRAPLDGLPPGPRRLALAEVERQLLAPGAGGPSVLTMAPIDLNRRIGIDGVISRALTLCFEPTMKGPARRRLFLAYLMGVTEAIVGAELGACLRYVDYFSAALRAARIMPLDEARALLAADRSDVHGDEIAAALARGRADAGREQDVPTGLAEICGGQGKSGT